MVGYLQDAYPLCFFSTQTVESTLEGAKEARKRGLPWRRNDDRRFREADARWSQNAQDIANFLSSANPHWPAQDVADLLALHLKLTKDEVVARMEKRWTDDIDAFDQIFTEILTVSDVLTDGIVEQFPEKF